MILLTPRQFIDGLGLPEHTYKIDVWLRLTQSKIIVPSESDMISFYDAKGYYPKHLVRLEDYYTNFIRTLNSDNNLNLPFVRIKRCALDNYIYCIICHINDSTDLKLFEGFSVIGNDKRTGTHIQYGINLESALCLYL